MKKLGDINFELEKVVNQLLSMNFNWSSVLIIFYHELQEKHPKAREEYMDGTSPKFTYGNLTPDIIGHHFNDSIHKEIRRLVKQYVKDHDLQWGEVLYIVYGYLAIHAPGYKDLTGEFKYQ